MQKGKTVEENQGEFYAKDAYEIQQEKWEMNTHPDTLFDSVDEDE